MIGQTVSHYQIVRKIGQGGMGAVYEAKDLKLPRSVALKFLPTAVASSEGSETRFLQEARIVSTLEHPNIASIHDIDETDTGEIFIVMPYYEGRTLKTMIQEGSVSFEKTIDIICQAGRGLAKAHDRGIVHRDIKPANIIVTPDGIAKILDFGVALLSDETRLTQDGRLVGTVKYMSPEQAIGGDVDHRTDIWSLAVVLFELLTGKRPFRGNTMQAALFSIIHDDPADITSLRQGMPEGIDSAMCKALQKDPNNRFALMTEFVDALLSAVEGRPIAAASPPTSREISIAVLPFDDLSPGKDHEYLSDGLTDEVITDLSKFSALRVISRNSAIRLKGTTQDLREIGQSLNVQFVLRGSVRRAADHLRISVQLIDIAKDKTLWAEKFSGNLGDVFTMQEQVANSIVEALHLNLTPLERRKVEQHPIVDPRAYEYYLRARQEVYSVRPEGMQQALQYLQSGLEIVGQNVMMYAALAQLHFQFLNTGLGGPEHLERAEHYVDQVLALDPDSAHGHRLRGLVEIFRRKFSRAAMEFTRALEIDRNDPDSLFWLANIYLCAGQMQAASTCIDELLKIDPLTPINRTGPAWIFFFDGQFHAAARVLGEVYEQAPDDIAIRYQYVHMLVYSGQRDRALELAEALRADAPDHPLAVLCSLLQFALQGDGEAHQRALTAELGEMFRSDPVYCWFIATSFASLHQPDPALQWLAYAVENCFVNYPFLANHDRLLDPIRSDPRFANLMKKVEEAWESFDQQTAQTKTHLLR
jgi:serine/threonine protein kinase/Tfp pilus assembly protein PilF